MRFSNLNDRAQMLVRCALVTACLFGMFAPVARADAAAITRQRTPPYDFGCFVAVPCGVNWSRAQRGTLEVVTHPSICVVYGPPFLLSCYAGETSWAGVNLRTARAGRVRVTATLRDISPSASAVTRLDACLGLVYFDDGTVWGYGPQYACWPLSKQRSTTIEHTFDDVEPGSWSVVVSLSPPVGLVAAATTDGSAAVDRVTYSVI
jgi:hypothetical protein